MAAPLPSIDRYAVEAELGSGGFGAVYRARHVVLDRKVALKVLHPQRATDSEVMQRFLREARAVASLGSPYIVQVLDADTSADGRAFIAMELLEGEDLAHRLLRGRMPTHEVLRIGREVLAALTVAHAQGVVHRDLKPGNVFLARAPNGEITAKVLDFGISKVRTEAPADELTRTGTMLGTPHYMAPEQFRSSRDVDARADLYSLGVLLYEALAGKLPFEGATLQQLIAVKLTDAPRPLAQVAPDVPHAVAEAVMRALEPEPDRRYASAAAMDAALAAVETRVSAPGVSIGRTAPMRSAAPPPASRTARRVLGWTLGIGAVIVLGGALVLAVAALGLYVERDALRAWLDGPAPAPSAAPRPPSAAPVLPLPAPTLPLPVPVLPLPVPASPPSAPSPAASSVAGVRVVSTALGMVDADGVREVGERARTALAACRGARAYHEQLQFTVTPGGVLMPSGLPTEGAAHDCVVDSIQTAGPVRTMMTGIARFDVTLEPR